MELDESSLTGESLPVTVRAGEKVRSGGIVRRGQSEVVVSKTGISCVALASENLSDTTTADTYIGEAFDLVAKQKPLVSSLQRVLIKLARVLIILSLIGVFFIFFTLCIPRTTVATCRFPSSLSAPVDAIVFRHHDYAVIGHGGPRFASKPPPAVAFMGRFGFEALGCSAVRF